MHRHPLLQLSVMEEWFQAWENIKYGKKECVEKFKKEVL